MIKLNIFQKLGSYIIPVKIWKGSSALNPVLELFFYRGEWQLGTSDAIYSNGTRYRPLQIGFREIGPHLQLVNKALVLGAGLGSAAAILSRMGYNPDITLVDVDEVVIKLAAEVADSVLTDRIEYRVENAMGFINTNTTKYDLLVIDIFEGRLVPGFVSDRQFLASCKNALSEEGYIVANYMISASDEWKTFLNSFKSLFPAVTIKELGINRVLIAKV